MTIASLLLFIFIVIPASVLIVSVVLYFTAQKRIGGYPNFERRKRYARSPQFNPKSNRFRNQFPRNFQREMDFIALLRGFLMGQEIRIPRSPIPSVRPDLEFFLAPQKDSASFRLCWLGHSTALLRVANTTILIDPTLSKRISPIGFFGARFQPPPISIEELPAIDVLLMSHDHYDHLDYESIIKLESLVQPKKYITTLGVGARLESFGVAAEKIVELDWWDSINAFGLNFIATPGQHFSGRSFGDSMRTLWCGFTIRVQDLSIYYTGDSGYNSHFKEIAERLGPQDFALVEAGQYNQLWRYVHLLPEDSIQAALDVGASQVLPLHWGMYTLSFHDWFDPIEKITNLAEKNNLFVHTPILGQVIELKKSTSPDPGTYPKWWREHSDFKKRNP